MINPNIIRSTPLDYEGPLHMTNRGRVLAIGALAAGALTTGVGVNTLATTQTEINRIDLGIQDSAISTVDQAANILANEKDINPSSIGGIFDAGTEVDGELQHLSGRAAQPGESITVTLKQNGLGQYSVYADPANSSHLEK